MRPERRRSDPPRPAVGWRLADFDAFLRELASSLAPNDITLFLPPHGSCRMGSSPAPRWPTGAASSHDVEGVWIGDAARFHPLRRHPMIAIMALAHRTGGAHLERRFR